MVTGGLLVGLGLVIGAAVTYAAEHHSSHHEQVPFRFGMETRPLAGRGLPPGNVPGPPGLMPRRPPVMQLVHGTVEGKTGTAISIRTPEGTTECAVTPATQVVRDGRTASIAEVKVGDPVLVQVGPAPTRASTKPVAIRVITGTSASGLGPRLPGPPAPNG